MSMDISKGLKQKAERALPTATKRVGKKVDLRRFTHTKQLR